MNTISAIKAAQRHHHQQKQDEKIEYRQPKQYALVMHMTHRTEIAVHIAIHILQVHLQLGEHQCYDIITRAGLERKSVVKPCTKDVGETLLAEINKCVVHAHFDDVKLTLETI